MTKDMKKCLLTRKKKLAIDKSVLESDVKNFITEQTSLEKESASYKANLLDLSNKIKEIGMAAQNFVTQHHNYKKVAQLYLDTWKLSRL